MPCFERFNRQPQEYREEVLPNECRKRVAIEAGVTGNLVSVRRSRRKGRRTAPVRPERTRPRGDERTRHRRAARDRSSEIAEVEAIDLNRLLRMRRDTPGGSGEPPLP